MNRKNISILISVFIMSFVISILSYILITQNLEVYNFYKKDMPEHITLYSKVKVNEVEKIKKLENVKLVGLRSEPKSLRCRKKLFTINRYDENYFSMQKNFLKIGELPKNKNELLVSEKTLKNFNLVLGDEIEVEKGERILKNKPIEATLSYNKNEIFKSTGSLSFKIVGVYDSKSNKNIQEVYSLIDNKLEMYPCIQVKNLLKTYETKAEIEKIVGDKNPVLENINLLRFFDITEKGFNILGFISSKLLVIVVLIIIFTFMMKNIFKIWGIYKIKEFSMYKSIGATNFQIYLLLFKEIFKISILPIILGEISGLFIILKIFNKLFSLQSKLLFMESRSIYINWISIIVINLIIFIILFISITFPTKIISKISILEGLKENIQTKSMKKTKHRDLFKELKKNNNKNIRAMFAIMITGLCLILLLICVNTIDVYNGERNINKRNFNLLLRYSTNENVYPKIFDDILKEFESENAMISIKKNYYVNTDKLNYSKEFNNIGYSKGFDGLFYYSEDSLVDGTLVGIDKDRFARISKNNSDVILVNLVQEDPKSFYSEASFIQYIDKNVDKVYIRALENLNEQEIKIDKKLTKFIDDQESINLYQVYLVTSIENFQKIIKESEKYFAKKGMEFPRMYYELEMKVDKDMLEEYSSSIEKIMENTVESGEKFIVKNQIRTDRLVSINEQGKYFIGLVIILSVILLNIANSYSSANLTFFNRSKEIGSLLSNGMYVEDLEKMFLLGNIKNIFKSIVMAILLTSIFFGLLLKTIPYMNLKKYMSIFPLRVSFAIICGVSLINYIIYYVAMKKVTSKNIVELVRE